MENQIHLKGKRYVYIMYDEMQDAYVAEAFKTARERDKVIQNEYKKSAEEIYVGILTHVCIPEKKWKRQPME